jgi:hypothetical protein
MDRRTYNEITKRKGPKNQIMVQKTLHRKLQIESQEPYQNPR